jgi:hypothetical protein
MADLITSARAQYNINQSSFTATETSTIAALITAVTRAISKFCRRNFDTQTYDELYNGTGDRRLVLRQFPLVSVARVAYGPIPVLRVSNTGAANQRATVAVTATGLSLTRVASGTSTTDTSVTWASYPTLTQVAAAVNALGNGWSAVVADGSYANRASADLRAPQGALNAMNIQAPLLLHAQELSGYDIDADRGWLIRGPASAEMLDAFDDPLPPTWFGGLNFWRVVYTAGFATVPDDVQEACAEWVARLFWQTKRDPGLASESVPGAFARSIEHGWRGTASVPADIKVLLEPYRDHKLNILGG